MVAPISAFGQTGIGAHRRAFDLWQRIQPHSPTSGPNGSAIWSETSRPCERSNKWTLTAKQSPWATGHISCGGITVCPAARGVAFFLRQVPPQTYRVRRETKCPTQFARYVDPTLLPSLSIIRDGGTPVRRVEHLNFGTSAQKCAVHTNTGTKRGFNYLKWHGKPPMRAIPSS